jgi:N-ethylmaleimide reductase
MEPLLFSPARLGSLELRNRIVLAPMTRCRAIGNVPNALMAEYYAQRAGFGLLITEGTAPSANGLGYARIPGAFSAEQIAGWRLVTEAVRERGGKIFLQLMHVGRVARRDNMPAGSRVVAPSAVPLGGEMWTDGSGMQPHTPPEAMTQADIEQAVAEFVQAARHALEAGFHGVELHGANGYLIEQFLAANTNLRTDDYGGSETNRARFALAVARSVAEAVGPERVGIRLSPYGVFNDIEPYGESLAWHLAEELGRIGVVHLHTVDHAEMGAPEVPRSCIDGMRERFEGSFILSGGYTDAARAEADLRAGRGDLIAFGRAGLANPDLPERLRTGARLNEVDPNTLYTAGPEGHTDYPTLAA